jgi:hypothetical protein
VNLRQSGQSGQFCLGGITSDERFRTNMLGGGHMNKM